MAAALAFQENSLYNKKQYARFGPGGTAFAARIVKGLNFLANQKKMVNDITSMDVDFSKWYTDIVKKAELMDYSSVKGCMIIEPYGYAIWENIQHELDDRFKATGHQNVYMPLFIPESLLQKEKDHVKGFAPEVAWAYARRARFSSASITRRSSTLTATCRSSTTSGAPLCAGRKRRVRSCAPPSSCGRKATPCTKPQKRPWKRPCACCTPTRSSTRTCSPFRL